VTVKNFVEFYEQVESARTALVEASIWYAVRVGDRQDARELSRIVGRLVGWCEEFAPSDENA
jgi:hypothetical protein